MAVGTSTVISALHLRRRAGSVRLERWADSRVMKNINIIVFCAAAFLVFGCASRPSPSASSQTYAFPSLEDVRARLSSLQRGMTCDEVRQVLGLKHPGES